jgi:enoyl-CoA hydratase/carnithine racemase
MTMRSVALARDGAVATITLDSADARNALDPAMRAELADACASVASDDAVRVVLLTGAGATFATGDEPMPSPDEPSPAADLAALPQPTVAWVNGDCLDMGLELALACDVRVAGPHARMAMRQVASGSLPWNGGTQRLVRIAGRGHALRLLLAGDVVTADEALGMGLVQQIGGREAAMALAERIAAAGPIAVAYAKEAVLAAGDTTLDQGLRLEADLAILLHATADCAEGLRAFSERRVPRFEGR